MYLIQSSFNPYFAGSSSGSFLVFWYVHVSVCVSILILLEVVLEDGDRASETD